MEVAVGVGKPSVEEISIQLLSQVSAEAKPYVNTIAGIPFWQGIPWDSHCLLLIFCVVHMVNKKPNGLFMNESLHFRLIAAFIAALYTAYSDLYFTYLEINPLGKYFFLTRPLLLFLPPTLPHPLSPSGSTSPPPVSPFHSTSSLPSPYPSLPLALYLPFLSLSLHLLDQELQFINFVMQLHQRSLQIPDREKFTSQ